ncbi:hypothetical protein L2E82_15228 [Cichorium intybus]|uniref:Uncharacterized protein n=1 Tax=Cichorium intybus TaxID=13427 RepID=A0ACB9F2S1_CICIN|nr:hypothetical protein L2E82_15228 [Cichorium intybus]
MYMSIPNLEISWSRQKSLNTQSRFGSWNSITEDSLISAELKYHPLIFIILYTPGLQPSDFDLKRPIV